MAADTAPSIGPIPQAIQLAIGRLLGMGTRPTQAGDIADYERCRAIILRAYEDATQRCA